VNTCKEQPYLPLSGSAIDAAVDRDRLRDAQTAAARTESTRITGKRLDVFSAIVAAGATGLTMREMAGISGRSINCWTQPFADLRSWGVITTTDMRRNGGTVHTLKRSIVVQPDGQWE
jgi:hypothetical protein